MHHYRLLRIVALLAATIATVRIASPAQASDFPNVFQATAVFSSNLRPFTNWTNVMERAQEQLASAPACTPGDMVICRPAEWDQILAAMNGAGLRDKVELVNQRINAHPYVAAIENWGVPSYWETPFEFLTRNGQCEDYAIAKYMLLRASGVSDDLLRVAIVHDDITRLDHAILLVDIDDEVYVLDNQSSLVLPATAVARYAPYYAINQTGWWLMQQNRYSPEVAALSAGTGSNPY